MVVAGGGPAGMAAAIAAADAGASVLLVEEEYELGRFPRRIEPSSACWASFGGRRIPGRNRSPHELRGGWSLRRELGGIVQRGLAGIHGAADQGPGQDPRGGSPGLIERPYVFEGNDLPGVMLSTGVRRLINLWAVKPGTWAMVMTANGSGDAAIDDLERAGVGRRVADARRGEHRPGRAGKRAGPRGAELTDGTDRL